ncbi:hypothetical protein [Desulfovibrio intestinalis]|uniref:Uncharacterized protein n=1 Tax=Desulfovibrio intestinalis TaxID=58621 RepID=A0A7W8FI03_9BACT|nr:hypothetical protein [Desulfovibrio intestinalis]MBB5144377.1 hypothetical protein [Desulfovibrio intestinalis]
MLTLKAKMRDKNVIGEEIKNRSYGKKIQKTDFYLRKGKRFCDGTDRQINCETALHLADASLGLLFQVRRFFVTQ